MGEHLDVENFSSTILRKQLEQIKEKKEIRDVIHESIETEISLPCLFEAYDSEKANLQFWYSMAEKLASECDKLEEDNVKLENLINDRETRLNELKNLNAELLEEAHYLDNDTHEIKSIASSSS
ncbi:hypothetical protein DINM_002757 [Dirofilaria immitis]|nr:hypothetical protein [Dirofilaria immitis]